MSSTLIRSMSPVLASSSTSVILSTHLAKLSRAFHVDAAAAKGLPSVNITFVDPDGSKKVAKAPIGWSLLDVAHLNDVELEGACEGQMACSTCHCILSQDLFDSLPEPTDEEEDLLDLAPGLEDTSRLGCQALKSTCALPGDAVDGMVECFIVMRITVAQPGKIQLWHPFFG
ncbi:2Fe-2S ferredoxin, putative [Perkinsus marinus ATCC 50983]|uniref:2Fe-2S ferredoxin n=1 Tax=Perkinsus marinus (strain ATCC 50983 / TXsc) TaxID=423536 RepID=C5L4I0_PERM5|nr:2Fe-2S ferredoxin, putative [Perkinsus marinus ATCC 50983]EER08417.1 2Fe-2S ferredoxin, putative [Perkinsus marinus ATCC 50983]|eukprot:XP_002776601.1 2Fe-2S ferredoxin, putative [Perkinsus marinus ATCC 50983]